MSIEEFLAGGRLTDPENARIKPHLEGYTLRSGSLVRPKRPKPKAALPRKSEGSTHSGVILVGRDHQADVPDYMGAGPYEGASPEEIRWSPAGGGEAAAEAVARAMAPRSKGPLRDDESALDLLMLTGYDPSAVLALLPPRNRDSWHPDDCRLFETGLALYSKDFYRIRNEILPSRTVADLVLFYYKWKKSERHDVMVKTHRYTKPKYTVEPNSTDLMDIILDNPQPQTDENFNNHVKKETTIKKEPID